MDTLLEALWDIGREFNLRHRILPAEEDAIVCLSSAVDLLETIPYDCDSFLCRHETVGVQVRASIADLWAWTEASP